MREWLVERMHVHEFSFPVAGLGGALCISICSNEVLFNLSMEDG